MPLSSSFAKRLEPILEDLVDRYPTPFHIYDLVGILRSHQKLTAQFNSQSFRQYFAVKALPNPAILSALLAAGSGLDCSSPAELKLASDVGASGDDIVFTSNNTSIEEYAYAQRIGALITLDDRRVLEREKELPSIVAFRVAPSNDLIASNLMGGSQSKFGVPHEVLTDAYRAAIQRGATRFGIHNMTLANELSAQRAAKAAEEFIKIAKYVAQDASIAFDYINLGGGIGIPYRPEDSEFDFDLYAEQIDVALKKAFGSERPKIIMECGRCITGPHGVLVSRVITRSQKRVEIAGIDASMSSLMRPGFYGAYHHATLPFATGRKTEHVNIVGSLCENMDQFAIGRAMPNPREGDILLIHDTGAHGAAMGFTYNGRLRPAELLLTESDDIVEIRRPETYNDYIATVVWEPRKVYSATSKLKKQAIPATTSSGSQ